MRNAFDKNDLKIISCLRENSRQPLKKISKKIGLPISTIYDRIKKMEKTGLIESYTILIDHKKLMYPIKATLLLKANNGMQQKLEDTAFNGIYTNKLIKLTGDEYNYLLEGIFPNMEKLSNFLDMLCLEANLEKHKIYYFIKEIKKESFLEKNNIINELNVNH